MIHLSKDWRLVLPPDKDKVERDATGDYDERHRDAKSLVGQGEWKDENKQEEGQEKYWNNQRQAQWKIQVLSRQAKVDLGTEM